MAYETKYGGKPTNDLSTLDMRNGFKNMWKFYDSVIAHTCHFFIYAFMYIIVSKNVDILDIFYFYACRWNMKMWNKMESINTKFKLTQKQYPFKVMKK